MYTRNKKKKKKKKKKKGLDKMFIHDSGQSNPVQTPPPGLYTISQ